MLKLPGGGVGFEEFLGHAGFREVVEVDEEVGANAVKDDEAVLAVGVVELEPACVPVVVD